MSTVQEQILALARIQGIVRPQDLRSLGVSPNNIYHLLSSGKLVKSGRGLYMLADYDVTEHHTMVEAVRRQNKGVVCLLSALSYHGVGTQQPFEVWLAFPRGTHAIRSRDIPIHAVIMGDPTYEAGITSERLEGVDVRIYGVAKTIADCFKFRNKVGLDVALEALREAIRERRCTREEIWNFAKLNRVAKVMRPYLESFSL